jgi:hypothetical protein
LSSIAELLHWNNLNVSCYVWLLSTLYMHHYWTYSIWENDWKPEAIIHIPAHLPFIKLDTTHNNQISRCGTHLKCKYFQTPNDFKSVCNNHMSFHPTIVWSELYIKLKIANIPQWDISKNKNIRVISKYQFR